MTQRGSSLIEVVVMMVIMSVSLVGIYSLVHSAQNLAIKADDRLIASNIAREGIETIWVLRDTFQLRAYEVSDCFFTIDGSNADVEKCPQINTVYYLQDNKTLSETGNAAVCINSYGWYSQEYAWDDILCTEAPPCRGSLLKSCLTKFQRSIQFQTCEKWTINDCLLAQVSLTWWDETLKLEQVFTSH